jgi:hypothetical protein
MEDRLFVREYKGNIVSARKGRMNDGTIFFDVWYEEYYMGMHLSWDAIFECINGMKNEGLIA